MQEFVVISFPSLGYTPQNLSPVMYTPITGYNNFLLLEVVE